MIIINRSSATVIPNKKNVHKRLLCGKKEKWRKKPARQISLRLGAEELGDGEDGGGVEDART